MPEGEPSNINQEIVEQRQDLGRHLQELETKVDEATSVETYVRKTPGLFIGLALAGVGLLTTVVVNRFRR